MSSVAHPARYHPLSVLLHWGTAGLVLLTLGSALVLARFPPAPSLRAVLLDVHLIAGQLLFLAQLLQLMLFSAFGTPTPDGLDAQQVHVARVLHALLYGTVGFLACSGTLLALAYAAGKPVLGWKVPVLLSGPAVGLLRQVHGMAGLCFVVFCAAHAVFACCMHYLGKRGTLRKMAIEGALVDYLAAPEPVAGYACTDRSDRDGGGMRGPPCS
ncbi:cytochrome b/b6 domain-containing protein [Chitiniphilus purpureus]|uniref:Cytochrome b/b6 domain-containing protein n=1 Tax=Chitiniphilus purpureus TaxID=2981137 RepID=A0ABY6DR71_9NEIS|nr:cytochrome b/b6 domain-containing protein [Chitiniphilus sp. CD1]UXY16869.1 cytochrome b/b6 domain-containing protein [Chitiniphilus sp. CD1]